MSKNGSRETDLVVIGAGPGGYAAAFHAADLGLRTLMVDSREKPGGVCLQEGCIPSKALLHVSGLLGEARGAEEFGVRFGAPKIDLDTTRSWKEGVIATLTGGLTELARRRGVDYLRGYARFESSSALRLEGAELSQVRFKHAIVATGSRPAGIPGLSIESERVMDSTGALELRDIPASLLVVGGGYIGLELGTVYAELGSRVTMVELTDGLLPGVDRDLVRPLAKRIEGLFDSVHLNTRVVSMEENSRGISVQFEGDLDPSKQVFDRVLVAVGRKTNTDDLGLENTRVERDEAGFIKVDAQLRTADSNIFAIGDVAGQPMLAHKATREGKVAAEVISGQKVAYENVVVPAVVFTDPEIAWCGLTEGEARAEGKKVKVTRFPWAASGRALSLGRSDGLTKLVLGLDDGRVLGVGVVGPRAGDLIGEAVLAIEMAAVAEDLASIIHAHPTLSETMGEAAEGFLGQMIHLYKG